MQLTWANHATTTSGMKSAVWQNRRIPTQPIQPVSSTERKSHGHHRPLTITPPKAVAGEAVQGGRPVKNQRGQGLLS